MRIFVGNLAWSTTEDELQHLFEPYGAIARTHIMTDRETGRSRGFGFVEMPNLPEANAVIAGLNGTALGGRQLTVNEARAREGDRTIPVCRQPRVCKTIPLERRGDAELEEALGNLLLGLFYQPARSTVSARFVFGVFLL